MVSAQIWQGPTQAPTGGNVSTPLNTSNTGQIKDGGLILGATLTGSQYGLRVRNGLTGLGTDTPTEKLDVVGKVKATALQIQTATPSVVGQVLTATDTLGNASWQTVSGGASQWTTSGTNIYNNNSGNIAIGSNSASPNYRLKLSGEMYIDAQNSQGNGGVYIDLPDTSGINGEVAMTLNSRNTAGTKVAILSNKQNFEFFNSSTQGKANLLANQVTLSGGSPGVGKVLTSNTNGLGSWEENVKSSSSAQVCGLIVGKKYLFIVYGAGRDSANDGESYTISATINGVTSSIYIGNHPDGTPPVSIPIVATANATCVTATTNNFFTGANSTIGVAVAG